MDTPRSDRALDLGCIALLVALLLLGGCVDGDSASDGAGAREGDVDAPPGELTSLSDFGAFGDPGGQTGDGTGIVQGTDTASGCSGERAREVIEAAAHDEVIGALGFSPSDLLAWAGDGSDASVSWDPAGSAAMASTPAGDGLHLRIVYAGGEARFFDGTLEVNEGEEPSGSCPPLVELDVEAELTTDDGTLSEQFPATLRSGRDGVVQLVGAFDAAALAGTLAFEPSFEIDGGNASWADAELLGLLVEAVFTEHGSYGRLTAHTWDGAELQRALRPISAPIAVIAVWPADAGCAAPPGMWELTSNVTIDGDVIVLGETAATWRGLFDELPPLRLDWQDGSTAGLEVRVEVRSEACYRSHWSSDGETLGYGVRLTATADDGSLAGSYDGFVSVYRVRSGVPDEVGHRVAALGVRAAADADDPASLGVGAAAEAADMAATRGGALSGLELSLGLFVDVDGRRLGGELSLRGERDLGCFDTDALTQDSCLSSLNDELLEATITPGTAAD